MALYEPLREGFREFNRMVTDRQVFNEQAKAREAADKRSDIMLASQLENQEFDRIMRGKAFKLSEDQFLYGKSKDEKESIYRKGRDEVLDQQWQDNHDFQKKQWNSLDDQRAATLESTVLNNNYQRKKNELDNKIMDDQLDAWKKTDSLTAMSGFGFMEDDDFVSNGDAMLEIATNIGATSYDPKSKQFLNIHDEPIQLTKKEVFNKRHIIRNIYDKHFNTSAQIAMKLQKKSDELAEVSNKIMKAQKATHTPFKQQELAHLKVEKSRLEREAKEISREITPTARYERLSKRLRAAERAADTYSKMGEANAAAIEMERVKNITEQMKLLEKDPKNEFGAQRTAVIVDPDTGTIVRSAIFNIPKNVQGAMPGTFDEVFKHPNAMWLDVYDRMYKDKYEAKSGWGDKRKTSDINYIAREIDNKFAQTVWGNGGYAMSREVGVVRDMVKAVAATLSSTMPDMPTESIPSNAILEFEDSVKQYFAQYNLILNAPSMKADPVSQKAMVAQLNEQARMRFGGRIPTMQDLEIFTQWKKGLEYDTFGEESGRVKEE